jgi:hypothetical protein
MGHEEFFSPVLCIMITSFPRRTLMMRIISAAGMEPLP